MGFSSHRGDARSGRVYGNRFTGEIRPRLVELQQQGLLTDDEFTALKARLIEG